MPKDKIEKAKEFDKLISSKEDPNDLVNENDPFYFLNGLEPYLHRSKGIKESKSTLIQSVLSIINEIACYNSRISMNLCQTIVDDVCILILCSKNSGIVDYATKCLTSFASLSVDSREKLKRLTRALMLILCRESKLDEERRKGPVVRVQRAIGKMVEAAKEGELLSWSVPLAIGAGIARFALL